MHPTNSLKHLPQSPRENVDMPAMAKNIKSFFNHMVQSFIYQARWYAKNLYLTSQ